MLLKRPSISLSDITGIYTFVFYSCRIFFYLRILCNQLGSPFHRPFPLSDRYFFYALSFLFTKKERLYLHYDTRRSFLYTFTGTSQMKSLIVPLKYCLIYISTGNHALNFSFAFWAICFISAALSLTESVISTPPRILASSPPDCSVSSRRISVDVCPCLLFFSMR